MMTKEKLQTRLLEIEKAIQQTLANYNLLEGGKQECLYWIEQLNGPPQAAMSSAVSMDQFKEMAGADSIKLVNSDFMQ